MKRVEVEFLKLTPFCLLQIFSHRFILHNEEISLRFFFCKKKNTYGFIRLTKNPQEYSSLSSKLFKITKRMKENRNESIMLKSTLCNTSICLT